MGFFKSLSKIQPFKSPAKAVTAIVKPLVTAALKDPVRATLAVTSGGASEALRAAPVVGDIYAAGTNLAAAVVTGGGSVALQSVTSQLAPQGGQPMAFNVGQFLGGVSQAFGQSSNPYLSGFGQAANIAQAFVPQPVSYPMQPSPVGGGQVYTVGNTVNLPAKVPTSGMTKEIFDAASKLLARLGIPVRSVSAFIPSVKRALSGIAALARRTPAGTIVSLLIGLGLTAMEANLLVSWQAQRRRSRRMNPANSKALRRAARRIKSFHKLCVHTDLIKTHHRRSAPPRRGCK